MLPPDSTATGIAAAGSASRWYSHAATAAAPPGSATSRAWPASRLVILDDAGHGGSGFGRELVSALGQVHYVKDERTPS